MSETASGLMRVVVLMLVTTAFAAVWSGDQQTQHAFIVARKAAAQRSQRTLLARRNAERVSHLSDASESSAADLSAVSVAVPAPPPPRPAATGPSIVARVEVEFSLPSDIAPGRYQVVDETGVLETIYVPVISDSFAEQDIYLLNLPDGRRRYFIRITDPTAVDLAAPTATNDARRRR